MSAIHCRAARYTRTGFSIPFIDTAPRFTRETRSLRTCFTPGARMNASPMESSPGPGITETFVHCRGPGNIAEEHGCSADLGAHRERDFYVLIESIAEIDFADRAEVLLVRVGELQALLGNAAARWAMEDPLHTEQAEPNGPEQQLQHRPAFYVPGVGQAGGIDVEELGVRRFDHEPPELRNHRMRPKPLQRAVQPFFVGSTHRPATRRYSADFFRVLIPNGM